MLQRLTMSNNLVEAHSYVYGLLCSCQLTEILKRSNILRCQLEIGLKWAEKRLANVSTRMHQSSLVRGIEAGQDTL